MQNNRQDLLQLDEAEDALFAFQFTQRGFSLIELMVVVAILVILVTVSGGAWSSVRNTEQVTSAAEKIRSMMTSARLRALSVGQKQYIGFDMANDTVVTTADGGSTYDDVANAWNAGARWESLAGVDLLDSNADGEALANPEIIKTYSFSARGTSRSGSVLAKSVGGAVEIGKIIVVNTVTGRVHINQCSTVCQ